VAIVIPIVTSWDGKGLDKATKELERAEGGWNKAGKAVDAMVPAAATAFAGVTAAAVTSIKAAEESAQSQRRLEQVFRSMGDTTGKAAKDAQAYASALSKQTGIDDELIQNTQAKIATFAEVSNASARAAGIFDRTTKAAADLAAAGFGSMESNAVQLGKALNDPVNGLSALARSGVTFTEAQKAQVAAMVKSNDMLGAQKLVLEAIEKQVGGTAAATATSSAKMSVAFGNVQEAIGAAMLPAFEALSGPMLAVAGFAEEHSTLFAALVGVIGAVAGAVLALAGAMKALEIIKSVIALTKVLNLTLLASPWFWVAAAIAAVIAAVVLLIKNWDAVAAAAGAAWDFILRLVQGVFNWIKDHWPLILAILVGPIGLAVAAIVKHWDTIKHAFTVVIDAIAAAIEWLVGVFRKAIDAIVAMLKAPLDALGKLGGLLGKIPGMPFAVAPPPSFAGAARARGGGLEAGGGATYQITVNGALDPDGVARQITALLAKAGARRGQPNPFGVRGAWGVTG
jgi:hypothetical protein